MSFRAHIACLQNIQLDWPPTQDQKQFQGGFTSLPGFPCLITRSHIIGPISSSFAQNAAYRNIDSRKKSRILIGKTKNSNLDRGKFQANHYFMLVQNKKEGRLNNVSNGSIDSPSSFKRNFRYWYWFKRNFRYCYYYYCL